MNEGGSGGAECGREWVNATGVGAQRGALVGAGVGERKGAGVQRVVGFGGRMVGTIGEAI